MTDNLAYYGTKLITAVKGFTAHAQLFSSGASFDNLLTCGLYHKTYYGRN